ncbi:hypothetical protein NFI96_015471 [Prochilodus magdalenae]|nr:hypothetical protein NFI96_015471 [Prochilodus magdalenae]
MRSQSLHTSKLHVTFRLAQEQCVELQGVGFHGRGAASKPYIAIRRHWTPDDYGVQELGSAPVRKARTFGRLRARPSRPTSVSDLTNAFGRMVEAAVKAAKEAFPGWSEKSPAERARVLNKLADLLEARLEEFAQAESKDQGKTVSAARNVEIPRAVYNFRYFASSILHHTTECSQMDHMGCVNYTIRCPVGVVSECVCLESTQDHHRAGPPQDHHRAGIMWGVDHSQHCNGTNVVVVVSGLISPWNLPLYLLTWKIAPAVAMGNTVVAKPSEMTSVTAWMMCQLLEEAGGVPPGVVNIVFGTGPRTGDALVAHPDVPLISFTGSTATARVITERSAPYCKKLSLELGGKNPAVVFADADMEECIRTTVRSSFSNQVSPFSQLRVVFPDPGPEGSLPCTF